MRIITRWQPLTVSLEKTNNKHIQCTNIALFLFSHSLQCFYYSSLAPLTYAGKVVDKHALSI